jgi:hypothetical protein
MSESERKKLLVGLETELRRTATALAVAQAEYEKAYTAMHEYMNANTEGPQRMLVFSQDVTVH